MTKKQALRELESFLDAVTVIELGLHISVPGSVGICVTVARIIHEYNSTRENEDRVCDLLATILKHHFNQK